MLIARLQADPHADQFALARMKKRKLRLKDMISYLENKLIPDLDA
ncbi:YdcH family protein [Metallibacterium sp.]|nr:YdcH family protein [Metallibacterium sp.]